MSLPKIIRATHSVKLPTLNKRVKIQAYSVGDKKAIYEANESKEIIVQLETMATVVANCILSKTINVNIIPIEDLVYLYLTIHIISAGGEVEVELMCQEDKCDGSGNVVVKLSDIDIIQQNIKPILLGLDKNGQDIAIKFKLITKDLIVDLLAGDSKSVNKSMIDYIQTGDNKDYLEKVAIEELETFFLSFETKTMDRIDKSFNFTESIVNIILKSKCKKCGHDISVEVKDFSNFFELPMPAAV